MVWSSPRTWTTGEIVTAAHMNQEVRDNLNAGFPDGVDVDSWTPLIESTGTDPTTSSNTGRQFQVGGVMHFWGRYVISANGSGNWYTDLPASSTGMTSSGSAGAGSRVGSWHARDDSTGNTMSGSLQLTNQLATDAFFFVVAEAGASRLITEVVPWTWASGDVLAFSGSYPVA